MLCVEVLQDTLHVCGREREREREGEREGEGERERERGRERERERERGREGVREREYWCSIHGQNNKAKCFRYSHKHFTKQLFYHSW